MELHIARIARLQHLHLHKGRDGLHVLGRQPVEKAEHELPPRPERIARIGAASFGQPRHGALKGVAVQVGGRRQQDRVTLSLGGYVARHFRNAPLAVNFDPHVTRPAIRQKRLIRPENRHALPRSLPVDRNIMCIHIADNKRIDKPESCMRDEWPSKF